MSEHVVPVRVYLAVFVALLALTALTVFAAGLDLGRANTPLALSIAATKAALVVLFFMHVRYASRLTQLFVAAGFVWLGFLICLTLADYLSRTVPFGRAF